MSSLPLWASGVIGAGIFFILMFLRMHVGMSLMIAGFIGFWMTRGIDSAYSVLSSTIYEVATSPYSGDHPALRGHGDHRSGRWTDRQCLRYLQQVGGALPRWSLHGRRVLVRRLRRRLRRQHRHGHDHGQGGSAADAQVRLQRHPVARLHRRRWQPGHHDPAERGVRGLRLHHRDATIAKLFISGILPGIILTVMFCIQIYIQCRLQPDLCKVAPRASWKERLQSLSQD